MSMVLHVLVFDLPFTFHPANVFGLSLIQCVSSVRNSRICLWRLPLRVPHRTTQNGQPAEYGRLPAL
jgi:hypothetical protein